MAILNREKHHISICTLSKPAYKNNYEKPQPFSYSGLYTVRTGFNNRLSCDEVRACKIEEAMSPLIT